MTISEMHHLFRVIGQAKGLQLVRAVLPESIDDYLNAAIMEKCRSVLIQNTSTAFPDKMTSRDNPISPYNALRTLFREEALVPNPKTPINEYYLVPTTNNKTEVLSYISVGVQYARYANLDPTHDNVKESDRRYACRIIEPDKIYYVLNDFCNAPSKQHPCCVIDRHSGTTTDVDFQIYTALNPIWRVYIGRIDMPAKVSLSTSVDCNLPDYLHHEIVEIAVNKYFQSVGSTTKQVN